VKLALEKFRRSTYWYGLEYSKKIPAKKLDKITIDTRKIFVDIKLPSI
tara:strand:- start:1120 stop:1263 length:144 start_codon:yes stop_codon:yes gene_type:complete